MSRGGFLASPNSLRRHLETTSPASIPVMALAIDDLNEAAQLTRTRAFQEIAAGRLRAKKAGRRTLVLVEDLQEYHAKSSGGATMNAQQPPRKAATTFTDDQDTGARPQVGAYQIMPPLPPETEAALRASIERFGVLMDIVVDAEANIIDGHHRLANCSRA